MTTHHESWAGNLVAWFIAVGQSWNTFGVSWTAVGVTCATLWWTIEKALTERARRRMYTSMVEMQAPVRQSMLARFRAGRSTEAGDLDSRPQEHHEGKG